MRRYSISFCTLLIALCSPLHLNARADEVGGPRVQDEAQVETSTRTEDSLLADYQDRLLTVAIDSVNAFPIVPHLKNRSRAQEHVVVACFELDQPERALRYAEMIENWRRGAAYADYAYYLAQHGDFAAVQEYLDLAAASVVEIEREGEQAWRRDRVRAKIARVYLELETPDKAIPFLRDLSATEFAPIAIVSAKKLDSSEFEDALAAHDKMIEIGDFEQVKASLYMFAEFFDRFYANAERRELCEQMVRKAWRKLPLDVRIQFLCLLADHAVKHGDSAKALQLIDEAQSFVEGIDWLPRHLVPLLGELAGYRYRAGDAQRARREADNALAFFNADREQIVDIFRAEALTPIAESYAAMGEEDKARAVYRLALKEATHNPNSRPRAEDLSAICCSMAVSGVEPDAELWESILEVQAQLGDPW